VYTSVEKEKLAPSVLAVRARISEETPRDLRGVDVLVSHLDRRLGVEHATLDGRKGPYGLTAWREDLRESRQLLAAAAAHAADALTSGGTPVAVATDCSLAIGTLPAISAAVGDVSVLWLDAHADYDVPATTANGFLGCMSLAGACGAWDTGMGAIAASRVVHLGARAKPAEFDYAGQEQGRAELRAMLAAGAGSDEVIAALGEGPVYVHLDPDVLDPSANPVPYGRPEGISADALLNLLREVRTRGPVVGVEVTAFHTDDDAEIRNRLCELLGDAVVTLIG
jgi:arginase family enzyme